MNKIVTTLATCAALGMASIGQAASIDTYASVALTGVELNGDVSFELVGDTLGQNLFDTFAIVNDYYPAYTADAAHTDPYEAYASASYSLASAEGSADANASNAASLASAYVEEAGSANAYGYGELGFDVEGNGSVTLSFGYSLFTAISDDSYGDAYALAGIYVDDSLGLGNDILHEFELYNIVGSYADSLDDAFDITIAVNGAYSGAIAMEAYTLADTGAEPVPVPAAGWLFLSALLTAVGAQRRHKLCA